MLTSISSSRSGGFTLVELLIAVVLGLFVVGGTIQIFLSGKAAYVEMQRFGELQSNIRFITDFITSDLRAADTISPAIDEDNLFVLNLDDEVIAVSITRSGGGNIGRNCVGTPVGTGDIIFNEYSFSDPDNAIFCSAAGINGSMSTTALANRVSDMFFVARDTDLTRLDPAEWADAAAIEVFVTIETGSGSTLRTDSFSFLVALRNQILGKY